MSNNLIRQQGSAKPDNKDNLSAIAQWWLGLAGQEIVWQQRLINIASDVEQLDWQPQKFDEKFVLLAPELRGITIFWRNNQAATERNITPGKLQLNLSKQQLFVYPQSQSQVVVRISLPQIVYQKLELVNPQVAATVINGSGVILLRDEVEQLEVKVTLNSSQLNQLLNRLQGNS